MLKGSLWALILYDVSEEIRLDEVRRLLGESAGRRPVFRGPSPEYVRFERPPVITAAEPVTIDSSGKWSVVVKYYDYGVVSVALELPFETDWDGLVTFSSRWIGSSDLERAAAEIARAQLRLTRQTLINPYESWTSEDYYAVHVRDVAGAGAGPLTARQMVTDHGERITQIVRAESAPLSDEERNEVLQSCLSYHPTDLMVVGWMAAFIYDSMEGARASLELLEYANTQLLEFRYYDDLLTKVLAGVYRSLEARGGLFRRWRTAKEAERLNRIRLDVTELTERVDNSIKFLSDMFYARAYKLAARKVGVNDYRDLVDEKLRTAADLYQSMVNEFHQARAFVLEAMVVAILIIELFNSFFRLR